MIVPGVPCGISRFATRTVAGVPVAATLARYRFRYTSSSRPARAAAATPTAIVPPRVEKIRLVRMACIGRRPPSLLGEYEYACSEGGEAAGDARATAGVQLVDVDDEV